MTEKWGPDFWGLLHLISINYPNNPNEIDKKKICNMIKVIPYAVPCSKCSKHFQDNLRKCPLDYLDISSKNNFVTWIVNLHNVVNKSLNKKIFSQNEAQNYINLLSNESYFDYLKKVIIHIESEIKSHIDRTKYNGIVSFIDIILYFSGKKYDHININFSSKESFKKLKDEIFKLE